MLGPRTRPAPPRRPGFSLAELMIALAILGIGLLVVAAALPVGVRYTKNSIDMAVGKEAAAYGLDLIERSAAVRNLTEDPASGDKFPTGLFVPRLQSATDIDGDGVPEPRGLFVGSYEPVIKVRPLPMQNIVTTPGDDLGGPLFDFDIDGGGYQPRLVVEEAIERYIQIIGAAASTLEFDIDIWLRPTIASTSTVYPPIDADDTYYPDTFYDVGIANLRTDFNPVTWRNGGGLAQGAEANKALDRRIVWTGFYRRVNYRDGKDPLLYEFITVACRLPSENHRFPVQRPTTGGSTNPDYYDVDTHIPVPWLVSFDVVPVNDPADYVHLAPMGGGPTTRVLREDAPMPATMTFIASEDVGRLLPPDSIFIPARNDVDLRPDLAGDQEEAGFTPRSTTACPIYKVVERIPDGGQYRIVVESNGLYPWYDTGDPSDWPVWVIPPAFDELDNNGEPLFSRHSPVLAVDRRYVTLELVP